MSRLIYYFNKAQTVSVDVCVCGFVSAALIEEKLTPLDGNVAHHRSSSDFVSKSQGIKLEAKNRVVLYDVKSIFQREQAAKAKLHKGQMQNAAPSTHTHAHKHTHTNTHIWLLYVCCSSPVMLQKLILTKNQ